MMKRNIKTLLKQVTDQTIPYAKICKIRGELNEIDKTLTCEPIDHSNYDEDIPDESQFYRNVKYSPVAGEQYITPTGTGFIVVSFFDKDNGFVSLLSAAKDLSFTADGGGGVKLKAIASSLEVSEVDGQKIVIFSADSVKYDLTAGLEFLWERNTQINDIASININTLCGNQFKFSCPNGLDIGLINDDNAKITFAKSKTVKAITNDDRTVLVPEIEYSGGIDADIDVIDTTVNAILTNYISIFTDFIKYFNEEISNSELIVLSDSYPDNIKTIIDGKITDNRDNNSFHLYNAIKAIINDIGNYYNAGGATDKYYHSKFRKDIVLLKRNLNENKTYTSYSYSIIDKHITVHFLKYLSSFSFNISYMALYEFRNIFIDLLTISRNINSYATRNAFYNIDLTILDSLDNGLDYDSEVKRFNEDLRERNTGSQRITMNTILTDIKEVISGLVDDIGFLNTNLITFTAAGGGAPITDTGAIIPQVSAKLNSRTSELSDVIDDINFLLG